MTLTIIQTIVEEFLHNKLNKFINAINYYNESVGEEPYHYTEEDYNWFWEGYESFAFFNFVANRRHIFNNNIIIGKINDDYNKGMVDIYDEMYIHHEYLLEYALHYYCFFNKEKIRSDLINYVDTTITLK